MFTCTRLGLEKNAAPQWFIRSNDQETA